MGVRLSDKKEVRYNKDGSVDKRSLFTGRNFTKRQRKVGGNAPFKGKPITKAVQWDTLGEYLTASGAKKYLAWVKTLKGKEFAREYKEMLNYFKPKQQSQQIKQDTSINIRLLGADNNILNVLGSKEEEELLDITPEEDV